MIISIGRQSGAGGREIAQKLAKKINFTYLDKDGLLKQADKFGYFDEMYQFYNEISINTLLQAISYNEVANTQNCVIIKEIYDKIASSGNFIILGRCANYFLRDKQKFFSVFLQSSIEFKIQRLLLQGYSHDEAIEYINKNDARKASFHKFYTGEIWGDALGYDLCINTSKCGIDGTIAIIECFLNNKF